VARKIALEDLEKLAVVFGALFEFDAGVQILVFSRNTTMSTFSGERTGEAPP